MSRKTKFTRTDNFVILLEVEKTKKDAEASLSISMPHSNRGITLAHYAWTQDQKERDKAIKEVEQIIEVLEKYLRELKDLPVFPEWKPEVVREE